MQREQATNGTVRPTSGVSGYFDSVASAHGRMVADKVRQELVHNIYME